MSITKNFPIIFIAMIISVWMHIIIPLLMNPKVVFNSLVANTVSLNTLGYAFLGILSNFLE